MKKIFILITSLAAGFTAANAQIVRIAPEIGVNFSDLNTQYSDRSYDNSLKPGLKVGGVVDISLSRYFSIQPGLFYSSKGAEEDYVSYRSTNNTTTRDETQYRYRIDYLEMPMNFQVKFGHSRHGRYFVGAGPYLGYALGGRAKQTSGSVTAFNGGGVVSHDQSSGYSLNIGDNPNTDDITRWDAGVNFNVGYLFRGGTFIRANYGQGLVNVLPGGDDNNYVRNWGFGLSLGFMIP